MDCRNGSHPYPAELAERDAFSVIKFGGSVLRDLESYARCACLVRDLVGAATRRKSVIVVSAEFGVTDRLRDLAHQLTPAPDPAMVDLLWSTGETRSVALMSLCLQRHFRDVVGLNPHQSGLQLSRRSVQSTRFVVRTGRLLKALERNDVVVVPGFLARAPRDSLVTLGRGGSDYTALLLTSALGAGNCRLIKDVAGYYTSDPKQCPEAQPLPQISFEDALEMAEQGCGLIHPDALRIAARKRIRVLVQGPSTNSPLTTVGPRLSVPPIEAKAINL